MTFKILQGDNRLTLKTLADNSIDAIVTDPPYGIDFLGKSWDANTGALETYQECLRVLKPGGHILAFSAARTYHHLAVTLEQAGFEIRDQIMWIYSSGFPKSQDIGKSIERSENKRKDNALGIKRSKIESGPKTNCPKCNKTLNGTNQNTCEELQCDLRDALAPADNDWAGWGTALKPAHEPIALARKPIKLSIAKNCQTWGTGALNIDATRIPYANEADLKTYINNIAGPLERSTANEGDGIKMFEGKVGFKVQKGTVKRLPSAGKRTASFHNATGGGETVSGGDGSPEFEANPMGRFPSNVIGEILQADYQKYFYCPKVSRRERHVGFDEVPDPLANYAQGDVKNHPLWDPSIGTNVQRLKHKIMENNKDLGKKGVVTESDKLEQMSGYFLDDNNQKTDKSSKNIWLPQTGAIYAHGLNEEYRKWCEANNKTSNVGNNHPTVKPIELMKYLIKLITPPGGVVLDPFNGSGSTGCAAVELGFEYIGCELDPAYVEIAKKRIEAWNKKDSPDNNFEELFIAA